MSQEWYVYKDGQQDGPYTWERLWELARSGALQPEDYVWTDGMSHWALARQIAGLTGGPASATIAPPPPPIGAEAPPPLSSDAVAATPRVGPRKARPWRLIAVLVGVVVLIAVVCAGGYVLSLRGPGLPALLAPTALLPPAETTATASDLGQAEEGTQQAVADTGEPTEQPPTPAATESPTRPADVEEGDLPTLEPTPEPTAEPSPTDSPTETPDASDTDQPSLPAPAAVVDEFVRVTLGTVPGAALDYDRARVLMTVAYAAEFDSPEFVPLAYGIQQGPTSYEIGAEEVSGSTATVMVLGYWGADLGRQWRFVLEEEAGLWRVAGIEVVDTADPADEDQARSPFWQLNPVLEEFTVYDHGGWKLVVAFDPPEEDIGADFGIAYRREDDGSLAYSQESSGVIEAGRVRLTLDSDWTGYDLSQLGFQPGKHRVVAYVDGVEIASGELIVE